MLTKLFKSIAECACVGSDSIFGGFDTGATTFLEYSSNIIFTWDDHTVQQNSKALREQEYDK